MSRWAPGCVTSWLPGIRECGAGPTRCSAKAAQLSSDQQCFCCRVTARTLAHRPRPGAKARRQCRTRVSATICGCLQEISVDRNPRDPLCPWAAGEVLRLQPAVGEACAQVLSAQRGADGFFDLFGETLISIGDGVAQGEFEVGVTKNETDESRRAQRGRLVVVDGTQDVRGQ